MYVATRFFVWIIDRDTNECYYIMLANANQWGEQVMQKNSVNKSVYSKEFLAMIRDNFDVAVATDIIGKSMEIKARYSDRKERGLKSDYT